MFQSRLYRSHFAQLVAALFFASIFASVLHAQTVIAPSNLRVTGVTTNRISVAWNDNSADESEFIILRAFNVLGPFEEISRVAANTTTFTNLNLTESTRYYYLVRASNGSGLSDYSNQTNAVTLAGLPEIIAQPLSQTVAEGQDVTLEIVARAKNLRYQWQFEGSDIPGATNSSLVLSNVTFAADGVYRVALSNTSGSVFSATATIRVNFALHAIATPGGQVIVEPNKTSYELNDNVVLTAVADQGAVFLGWTGDLTGTNTTNVLVMDRSRTVTAHFEPVGDIIVDNPNAIFYGSWTLSTAGLNQYGSSYKFTPTTDGPATAGADYTPNIRYAGLYDVFAWYPESQNGTTNALVQLVHNGLSETIRINQTTNGGKWVAIGRKKYFQAGSSGYVEISNETGETGKGIAADAFRFVLVNPPSIVVQPQNSTVIVGSQAVFGVVAGGSSLKYQWQFNGANIPAATNAYFSIPTTQFTNAGSYKVVVNNDLGLQVSDAANLTVNPSVPATFASMGVLADGSFHFQLTADPAKYLLEVSTNLVNWTTLATVTNSNGVVQFTDLDSTNFSKRFYRSRITP